MRIQINGQDREVPSGLDLGKLLEHLSLSRQRVAVELNREVVRKAEWSMRRISDGDRVEIVHFVGGG